MRAFAGNSLLAGWLQHKQNAQPPRPTTLPGDGWSAVALFVYSAGFSFAYLSMTAATGALLLFGAVQATMIAWDLHRACWVAASVCIKGLCTRGFFVSLLGP